MGFIAVLIEVYFALFLGDKMKANFNRFKRHLVPKISTLKPYQTRAHLSDYWKFGRWKLSLVSGVK